MRYIFITSIFLLCVFGKAYAQPNVFQLNFSQLDEAGKISLGQEDNWLFRPGHDPTWAHSSGDKKAWQKINPAQLNKSLVDEKGKLEGWLWLRFQIDDSLAQLPLGLQMLSWAAAEVYLDGKKVKTFGNPDIDQGNYQAYNPNYRLPIPLTLTPNETHELTIHLVDNLSPLTQKLTLQDGSEFRFLHLQNLDKVFAQQEKTRLIDISRVVVVGLYFLLMLLAWLIVWRIPSQKDFWIIAVFFSLGTLEFLCLFFNQQSYVSYTTHVVLRNLRQHITAFIPLTLMVSVGIILGFKINRILSAFIIFYISVVLLDALQLLPSLTFLIAFGGTLVFLGYYVISAWPRMKGASLIFVSCILAGFLLTIVWIISQVYDSGPKELLEFIRDISGPIGFALFVAIRFQEIFLEEQKQTLKVLNLTQEKQELLENQNKVLEQKVQERTNELNTSLENLKATQTQLIQSEKLASLGELTVGIAHEIQNPLNFVNNFSEVSSELVDEMKEELKNGDLEEVEAISEDLKQNLEKINHHGQRADAIVKNMLAHSRAGGGEKSLTDLNALAEEYLRLSFHGLRAKDKSFQADFEAQLEEGLPPVEVVSQEIGRVLLNLYNNAFYAVHQKAQKGLAGYKPKVSVQTRSKKNGIEIVIRDNGTGMPEEVKEKIFQPFFTTKPTGQGTGLGLSLAYDIISKGHKGSLQVETKTGEYTEFLLILPEPYSV